MLHDGYQLTTPSVARILAPSLKCDFNSPFDFSYLLFFIYLNFHSIPRFSPLSPIFAKSLHIMINQRLTPKNHLRRSVIHIRNMAFIRTQTHTVKPPHTTMDILYYQGHTSSGKQACLDQEQKLSVWEWKRERRAKCLKSLKWVVILWSFSVTQTTLKRFYCCWQIKKLGFSSGVPALLANSSNFINPLNGESSVIITLKLWTMA